MYFLGRRALKRILAGAISLGLIIGLGLYVRAGHHRPKRHRMKTGWALSRVEVNERAVALTFDDGPDPAYTPAVLALLRRYGDVATFFVLGRWAERYPRLLQEETAQGSEVANHGYAHRNFARIRLAEAEDDVRRAAEVIEKTVGRPPKFFRPPYGHLPPEVSRRVLEQGEIPTLWSAGEDSRDWARPGVMKIVRNVLDNVKSGDIILMHDGGGDRSQTVRALAIILPGLEREGYRLLTLSQLLTLSPERPVPFQASLREAVRTTSAVSETPPRERSMRPVTVTKPASRPKRAAPSRR